MKKIVLLSDGTGNGAAKRHKTNVWRLYHALDLQRDDQIAMYDDGVGSQDFVLFKLLGGAFGWGLKRNVVELYKFLCRNYEAGESEEESDKIYLFGFSRGAFTVRVLAGLIDTCGLCKDFQSERDLHLIARANYDVYRKKYAGGWLAKKMRRCGPVKERSRHGTSVWPRIQFVGVWDTVEAYGLPIAELAEKWHQCIFAMRFPDRRLSWRVRKACHALSIDDERHTFHPVLWDQREESNPERIEQVWFPGVHSDVGGGYPRYELALVSLDWMISKVEAADGRETGLVFLSDLREEYRHRCDWNGIQHDSRAGLHAFYRYKPRDIEDLCKTAGAAVAGVSLPKIHRSTFERIQRKVVPYAPTGLPARYETVTTTGTAPRFEQEEDMDARVSAMNAALDVIYWRRWLYRFFVLTTLLLIASLVLVGWEGSDFCEGLACLLDTACEIARGILPGPASSWFKVLFQLPLFFGLLVTVFYMVLTLLKHVASTKISERATSAWFVLKGLPTGPSVWCQTPTSRLRAISAGALGRKARVVWWWFIFGVVLMFVVVTGFWMSWSRKIGQVAKVYSTD